MDENPHEGVAPNTIRGNTRDDDAGASAGEIDAGGSAGEIDAGGSAGEIDAGGNSGEDASGGNAGDEIRDVEVGDEPQFSIDVPGSKPRFDYLRMGAGTLVGLAIVGIVLFSVTDLSSLVLPMEDRYLDVLVPPTEDGSEPFVLAELEQRLIGNTLSVDGRVTNMSLEEVGNVVAVVRAEDTTGRFPATLEIPVVPSILAPEETGSFSMTVTLREKPNGYSIRFKLENGPFVPHRDERGFGFFSVP